MFVHALGRRPAARLVALTRGLCSSGAGMDRARKDLAALLCTGGDSRLHLGAQGTNKYFCAPEPARGPVLRSSCTCSPPSAVGFAHALEERHTLEGSRRESDPAAFELAFGTAMESVRLRACHGMCTHSWMHACTHTCARAQSYTHASCMHSHMHRCRSCTCTCTRAGPAAAQPCAVAARGHSRGPLRLGHRRRVRAARDRTRAVPARAGSSGSSSSSSSSRAGPARAGSSGSSVQ